MTAETYRFAVWSTLILAAAVAVILYQHATHTAYVLSQMGAIPFSPASPNSDSLATLSADPANTISSNPGWSGMFSRASGQWTPLGPAGKSIFPYMPSQNW